MPAPEPHRPTAEHHDDAPHRVAGTVRLMTEDPFDLDDASAAGLGQRVLKIAAAKPWVIPAALMVIGVAFLVLRRRR
jgi:hypothetical protein